MLEALKRERLRFYAGFPGRSSLWNYSSQYKTKGEQD